jgi:hypothetical protein
MFTSTRKWILTGVAAMLLGGVFATASQAAPPRVLPNTASWVNPNWQVAPGLSLRQYSYNQRVLANGYSRYPAWYYGYNPYPSPVIYTSPAYNPYLYSGYSPYAYSPYFYNPYYGY